MVLNTRGLISISKRLSLIKLAYSMNLGMLCLSETWLDESIVDENFPTVGFNIISEETNQLKLTVTQW